MPKITLLLLMLFVSVAPVTAKEQLQADDNRVVLIKAIPGCANREEFEAMIDLAQRHDAVGFAAYMARHNCPVLQSGTAAVDEDLAFSGRAMCVRRPGDTSCLLLDTKCRGAEARAIRPASGVLTSGERPSSRTMDKPMVRTASIVTVAVAVVLWPRPAYGQRRDQERRNHED